MLPDYNSNLFKDSWNSTIFHFKGVNINLLRLQLRDQGNIVPGFSAVVYEDSFDDFRNSELVSYLYTIDSLQLESHFDNRTYTRTRAYLSLAMTVLVCLVLIISTYMLSMDAEQLVIQPIESMIKKVNRISENPLEAAALEEKHIMKMEALKQAEELKKGKRKHQEEEEYYEPSVLQKIIVNIGALLAIGFGEAGSEIIATNMAKSGSVDPMLKGKKIYGVFGFCDIRNFTDATEILKKEVMEFVNDIAHIVHSIVDYHFGAANKNIGDAFLLVWRIPEHELECGADDQLTSKGGFRTQLMTDLAILSFIKVISKISRSKVLGRYRENRMLLDRLGSDYRVRMGFGLHIGWAIEGAIGSTFKIDASYLSPNVNMAARLEAATKQFGVTTLIR